MQAGLRPEGSPRSVQKKITLFGFEPSRGVSKRDHAVGMAVSTASAEARRVRPGSARRERWSTGRERSIRRRYNGVSGSCHARCGDMAIWRRRRFLGGLVAAGCSAGAVEARSSPSPPPRPSLRVLTYNVLADADGFEERVGALSRVIEQADADVIALQEVSPPIRRRLLEYRWARGRVETETPGGQWLLFRGELDRVWFRVLPGPQRRTVLVADVRLGGTEIRVATTHMESFLEDGPIRAAQLDAIFEEVGDAPEAIVLGDFNFGDGEQPESGRLPSDFIDPWLALHPGDPGYTWNIERSEMARESSFVGEPSRRIDRVLLRSSRWSPADIEIVGDWPVHPGRRDLFPSDHFGLVASFMPCDPGTATLLQR